MTLTKSGPIEVWLSQVNLTVTCTVVHEDETTDQLDIDSLSMRGAQREITGHLINQGYKPDGRWTAEMDEDVATDLSGGNGPTTPPGIEAWRRFRAPAATKAAT